MEDLGDILNNLRIKNLTDSLMEKLDKIEKYDNENGGKILSDLQNISKTIEMRVEELIPDSKSELNKLIAKENGITVEQLIDSPNYQILCSEYRDSKSSVAYELIVEFVDKLNEKLKDSGLNIRIKKEEIMAMVHAANAVNYMIINEGD